MSNRYTTIEMASSLLTTKESEAYARVQDAEAEVLRNRRQLASKFFAKRRQFLSSNGVLFIHC